MINRNQRKRQFLEWLLQHFKHANPEVNQFLYYLMTEPNGIQYVKFTETSHFTPRGVYISYKTKTDQPFLYYKQHQQYQSCQQAFHDFRLNLHMGNETFYFEIDIPNVYLVLYEFDVFEENPYLPSEGGLEDDLYQALDQLAQEVKVKEWRRLIDEGLLNKNYEQVEYYLQLIEKEKRD